MTVLDEDVTNDSLTLGQQLAEGPLPIPEALRYAMMLAEALRQIHDSGHTCGDLQPSNIALTTAGIELHAVGGQPGAVTPYTAPEILQGQPPDSRSDIFAFGAIVYEMVTGRRAFVGDSADALAASVTLCEPSSSGTPSIDHLVTSCVAKDSNVRYQRMQKVILALKLITFGAPRAEAVAYRRGVTAALRVESEQLGARVALVEELCQRIVANVERVQQNTEAIDERVAGVVETMGLLHTLVVDRAEEFA